jgi:hypothetical protein
MQMVTAKGWIPWIPAFLIGVGSKSRGGWTGCSAFSVADAISE